ncbi:MAG: hypothetical protein ACE37H_13800 [Phycisphaeraceae bacterium]
MNPTDPPFNPYQTAALKRLRLRWGGALILNAPLPFVALPITGSEWITQAPDDAATSAMVTAVVLGGAAVAGGLFARNQIYKANWQGEAVTPAGYLKANTLFFIAVSVGALALFVLSILNRYPAPTFAAAPILIGLLALNFPNGKPMRPAPPRIDHDGGLP